MKNTIYDYVDLRGDLSPIDFPYNEIDFLILWLTFYHNPKGRKAIGVGEDYSHSTAINTIAIFVFVTF